MQELLKTIENTAVENYQEMFVELATKHKNFEAFETWKNNRYTRNCILKTPQLELLLLCWNPNDFSPIHDHNNENCWVFQVKGSIFETHYKKVEDLPPVKLKSQLLTQGALSFLGNGGHLHNLVNNSSLRATTLHLYQSPIKTCSYYCEVDKKFYKKNLTYDTP